jgi:archaellum component FlaG (FlaF/FlaG flagellin family)
VFEVNADVVNDPGNTLLNQAGINEAISFISANIGKTTIANASVLLTVEDGANTAIFQYQEGALDAGIQASELTLIGVLEGVTNINAGNLI